MDTLALLGSTLGLGLVAGFRLYAAVLAVGLGVRLGILHLNPGLEHLNVLASPWVLIPAGIACALEFLADKIPWVDSAWDAVHTLIRPLGAALLAATAVGTLDPAWQAGAAVLSGGIALSGHSAKAGARLVVNHSPEPFSNIGLSLGEDALALLFTWLAVAHPLVMLGIVAVFVALFVWLAPKVFRLLKRTLSRLFSGRQATSDSAPAAS